MPAADDLKTHALSNADFYALLSLDPAADQKGLDRAWRRTALKYHPDKVSPSDAEEAREKFHLASIGYEILSDATLRALYDRTRAARELRERQRAQLQAGRRAAREDLEARERSSHAAKRSAGEAFGVAPPSGQTADEEKLEREIQRLAEDGRRRREALQEKLRQKEQAAMEAMRSASPEEATETVVQEASETVPPPSQPPPASELDRTVKARFVRGETAETSLEAFEALFRDAFGDVDYAFEREGKKKKKKKKKHGDNSNGPDTHDTPSEHRTIVLTFTSLLGAHGAVEKWQRQQREHGGLWKSCDSVQWAAGKEPAAVAAWGSGGSGNDLSTGNSHASTPSGTSTPKNATNGHSHPHSEAYDPTTPNVTTTAERLAQLRAAQGSSDSGELKGTKKRFGSFAPPPAGATGGAQDAKSPFVGVNGAPSLEELTLMRLRHAEKRKAEAARALAQEQEEEEGNGGKV